MFKDKNEREQRRGDHEPDACGFGIHEMGTFNTRHPTFNAQGSRTPA
jgi:hypothetical protein